MGSEMCIRDSQYYLFDEDEERENPEDWIYTGYVYSLQDPYSTYYTAEEYESVQEAATANTAASASR